MKQTKPFLFWVITPDNKLIQKTIDNIQNGERYYILKHDAECYARRNNIKLEDNI